ncbi:integrase arm-type DNA-binding domain-containing protein [Aurantimonas sp. C2-6-R+9]|uniref:tyrosine-type recombinase/integrase n=1 Tax=unclassified Aurantimonas TaxID=2638230 RepID=UPI002E18D9F9|nr:integrase arm-type DNA-binding domain-containing protein [Aurantimonas sp. C2-6-R+9]
MPLTDTSIKATKPSEKPRKLSDGGGLYLQVQPTGGKHWRLAFRFEGKQKTLAFGSYPAVGLKDARTRRDSAKELLAKGIDPGEQKRTDKRKVKIEAANSFEAVAEEWFASRKDGWTPAYSERIWRRIEADLFPAIGGEQINAIEPPEILGAIRAVESRHAVVLAGRLLQVAGQIFRYAVASGRAVRDPTQDLKGALKAPGAQKHRSALKAAELPEFLKALSNYQGDRQTVLALRLVMHTAVRTSEARFAVWSEFEGLDGAEPLWRIPAERMKMRSGHLVPLSPQVVAVLRELKKIAGNSEYVLPAATKEKVISQNTMIYALYRLGYHSRATVHGFRGTFSTILNESGFNRDWIERQLAHTDGDSVRSAYNSAEWLSDRRAMLSWWSDYLDAAEHGRKVIPFPGRRA